MKIISKIKIHPFFYVFALLFIIIGYFKDFFLLSFIILFHETGHILVSSFFHFKIDKIIILPFGGITIFKEFINRPIKEEFFIAIAGPIFQSFLFLILKDKYFYYNFFLLIYNLLPIFPLDGSKILNLFLNVFFPFKKSHTISIVISFLFLSIFLSFNLVLFLIFLFLFMKTIKEVKEHSFFVNKFLFERYLYHFHYSKTKIIKGKNVRKMKRDYNHLFHISNNYYTEKQVLQSIFDKKY